MVRKLLPGLVASAVFAVSGSAWAENTQTTLTNVTNQVMVNQGEAYVPAEEGMVLAAGPGGKDLWILEPHAGAQPGMRIM